MKVLMACEHFYFDQIKIGGGDIFTNFSDRYYANGWYPVLELLICLQW